MSRVADRGLLNSIFLNRKRSRYNEQQLRRICQIAALLVFLANTIFSLVPPSYRPVTILPHSFEHFVAFFLLGLAFGLGYAKRYLLTLLFLTAYASIIELAQIFVPGRHARISDFLTDAIAATFGVSLPLVLRRESS